MAGASSPCRTGANMKPKRTSAVVLCEWLLHDEVSTSQWIRGTESGRKEKAKKRQEGNRRKRNSVRNRRRIRVSGNKTVLFRFEKVLF